MLSMFSSINVELHLCSFFDLILPSVFHSNLLKQLFVLAILSMFDSIDSTDHSAFLRRLEQEILMFVVYISTASVVQFSSFVLSTVTNVRHWIRNSQVTH